MSAIISIIKIIMFLFPFVKEIFVSKDKGGYDRRRKPSVRVTLVKKIFIVLICFSVVLNYYLLVKVYDLGRKNLVLQKQVKDKANKPIIYPKEEKPLPIPNNTMPPYDDSAVEYPKPKKPKPPKPKPTQPPTPPRDTLLQDLEEISKIR
jgi:hypothetical protein